MSEENENKNVEHFNKVRDMCHYACSSMNYINVVMIVVILILIYHFITTKLLNSKK